LVCSHVNYITQPPLAKNRHLFMLAHSLRLFGRVSVIKIWHQTPMLRCISSASNLHPMIQGFTGKLQQPKFAVSPNEIRILSKPTQFYSQIIVC
jgi:hypothetical protein